MCRNWNLEFAGMVGVGNQSRTGGGASACFCEVPRRDGHVSQGAAGTSTATAGAIVMLQRQNENR